MSTDTTPKTGLYALEVGDRVQVFGGYGRRHGAPGGMDGEVIKVGRKLITVAYPGSPNGQVFRLESGRANDDYGHQRIQTVEQAAEDARRSELIARLRSGGIELRMGHDRKISTETLEALAAVVDQAGSGAVG